MEKMGGGRGDEEFSVKHGEGECNMGGLVCMCANLNFFKKEEEKRKSKRKFIILAKLTILHEFYI